ncbi:alpha/beta fold hydrolase [Flavobacterium haoranii]|uniref:Pimeloyl-ACP methyl ester carboxylesterase n=1 Tax=Flavobacterium haoranii TaxID=683124 RepID=A0A1M6FX93_9FLAO|nr:alpha/beta fold hydrolase [Flavobacterium haoranii]SHJ02219.1 Pimeloyl-ACP methyl ester carboxylesterase [Flavobacterium haoranii]
MEQLYSKVEGVGKPFLILHGFLGMSDNWKTLGSQFSELGYQVHLLDLRNHGRSFHSDNFNYEVMAQDVMNYCEVNNLQDIVLLGHSMGGKVAMQVACENPSLVQKLIIADIGPKYYAPHHQTILAGLNAVNFTLKPSRSEVEDILKDYIHDFGTRQFLLKSLYWVETGQLGFRFNLPVFNEKIEEIGKALNVDAEFDKPVLFLRGSKSSYILDEDFIGIIHFFPQAIIKTIDNAGHWLHAENPIAFYENVVEFLKN